MNSESEFNFKSHESKKKYHEMKRRKSQNKVVMELKN